MNMMKKVALLSLIFVLLTSPVGAAGLPLRATTAYAPELMGKAALRTAYTGTITFRGTLVNGWVSLAMRGTFSGGYATGIIWQTAGPTLMDRSCPTCAEYPMKTLRFQLQKSGNGEFVGRIFFRGHWRKFCGAIGYVPSSCMLK